jgi:hypothetical protein
MSELRQERMPDRAAANEGEKLLAVRVSPNEVRHLTPRELEDSITQEDIQRGLDLAGAWSGLNLSEEELFEALEKMRHGSDPIPPIRPQ